MEELYRISDAAWEALEPHLPGQEGQWGGIAHDNRLFLEAVLWILKSGKMWKELPEQYGNWKSVYQRFLRWRNDGKWEDILEIMIDYSEFEWLIFDQNYFTKKTGSETISPYSCPWMRLIFKSRGLASTLPEKLITEILFRSSLE